MLSRIRVNKSVFFFFRLIYRLTEHETSEVEVNHLYNTFKYECLDLGCDASTIPGLRVLLDNLMSIFPDVKRVRKRNGREWQTLYRGIDINQLGSLQKHIVSFKDVVQFIPEKYTVKKTCDSMIICSLETDNLCNGNSIYKQITFHGDCSWDLSICGKTVNLNTLHVDNRFSLQRDSILCVCNVVEKMHLCEGVEVTKNVIVSRFHTLEKYQNSVSAKPVRSLRSVTCNRVVAFGSKSLTCRTCRTMTFSKPSVNNENTCVEKQSNDENVEKIKHLLKHADQELVNLFLEQSKNVDRSPSGRRWSKSFIGTCLQLYNRSPHCYQMLTASKLLILPSTSLLIMYKNKLKQEPGFDDNVFEWMLTEAKRRNIPEDGMIGGVIFDEMAVQSDVQISKNGDVVEVVGFTDLGAEGDLCNALRKGSCNRTLGNHVLQLLFLGVTGFRFPFAHFVTSSVQASELYGLFWKAVKILWTYGFRVLYTCMDGAVCNRSLMHICIGDNSYKCYKFLSPSPCTPDPVIFMMDISHVLKKIRNNVLKSGITSKCTRILTLPNELTVQWQMFIDAYRWDQQNSLQLHRKLSNDHLFPDSQLKMRNYLAEDILDKEMLNLMKIYRNSLGSKGAILDGAIEFLERTSELVSIFRDMRPIRLITDERLASLQNISEWFVKWEIYVYDDKLLTKKKMSKKLMSTQCHEDIQSCIQGFKLLCENVLKMSKGVYVTPGLINSDVIENIFNQQRSTYNGANSNPNVLQYRKTINNILLGQNTISRKSNAGKSISAAIPFTLEMKQPEKRAKKVQCTSSATNIKVIRM